MYKIDPIRVSAHRWCLRQSNVIASGNFWALLDA
jgi:hypothetical protein